MGLSAADKHADAGAWWAEAVPRGNGMGIRDICVFNLQLVLIFYHDLIFRRCFISCCTISGVEGSEYSTHARGGHH